MSLRSKLVLWYTGVFLFSGALLTTTLYLLVAHKMRSDADLELNEEYHEWCALTLRSLDRPASIEQAIATDIESESVFPLTFRLHDPASGRDVLFVSHKRCKHLAEELAAAAPIERVPRRETWTTVRVGKRPRGFRLLTGPLDLLRHPHLAVQVGMYTRRLDKRILSIRKYLFLTLGATVLLAAVGGWFLAARSLKPIDDLAAALSHVESSTLAERLDVGAAGDEVDRLREAINRTLERIEHAFRTLQSFTADAAHELRTPIAALQCRLEVALHKARSADDYASALSDALEHTTELTRLVENLLLLARMEAGEELVESLEVDLAAFLDDLAEPFALLAEQRGIALTVDCGTACAPNGNPMLLRRLFGNLLDNALRYTPAGGRVTLTAERAGDECLVTVADTGIGIDSEALGRVYDRFYRADESRSRDAGGTGLGLSIVKRVVVLHHGRITIESTPGEGTTVRVWLPCSLPDRA